MNKLHEVVEHVIAKERQKLKPSTFDVRKQYPVFNRILKRKSAPSQ